MIRDLVPLAEAVEKSGRKVYWLNIGDPGLFGFRPPEKVTAAIAEAVLSRKYTGYPHSSGDPELVEVLAKREGVPKERILVTAGLSEGIAFVFHALAGAGEHILLPSPGYSLYNSRLAAETQMVDKSSFYSTDGNFQPDLEDICSKINGKTKGIVIINPNNPTGVVYSKEVLRSIVEIAKKARIPIFADEIYDMLTLDGEKITNMRDLADGHIAISGNGISKNFFFPGARVGYLAVHGPENEGAGRLMAELMKQATQRLAVNWEMQRGALAAYTMPEAEVAAYHAAYLHELRVRRDIVFEGLNGIPGITLVKPEGAFYAFAQIELGRFSDDLEFTKELLHETGVFVIPGCGFSSEKPGFRVVFLAQPDELREAIAKIAEFMRTHS